MLELESRFDASWVLCREAQLAALQEECAAAAAAELACVEAAAAAAEVAAADRERQRQVLSEPPTHVCRGHLTEYRAG